MSKTRLLLALTTATITALTLASCSMGSMNGMGDETKSPSTAFPSDTSSFNDEDVMFAQLMIPHHEQAVEMAELILAKPDIDPAVTDLAQRIKDAQAPEIDTMTSWLTAWGAPLNDMGGMEGMDHGSDGMMSDDEMASLESTSGTEATRLFLEGMIAHHEGAIEMAKFEIQAGENNDALALAQAIVDSQSDEIAEMKALLAAI